MVDGADLFRDSFHERLADAGGDFSFLEESLGDDWTLSLLAIDWILWVEFSEEQLISQVCLPITNVWR